MIGDDLVLSVVSCLNTEDLQYDLLKEVFSLFVGETVDADLKMYVVSACVSHVEKQNAHLTRLEPLLDSMEETFRIACLLYKMLGCSKFFILSLKIRRDPRQKNFAEVFYHLLSKLPALVVMYICHVYMSCILP
jgi:hypothetical protein